MQTLSRPTEVEFAGHSSNWSTLSWLLHLYYLIGFRNRIVVMLNWVWYYWFHERQVRLITRREADQAEKN